MKLATHSSDLILVRWEENGRKLKMLVRKYSRDLMVFSEIFLEEGYLSKVKQLNHKEQASFIVDAGANIGCTAIFLNIYFTNAQLVCVEPEETNFRLLEKNIHLNELMDKVQCMNMALWNTSTRLNLMQRDWSSDAFHVMNKITADEIISTTETITMLKIMEQFNVKSIDFLKMDIEGAEKTLFEDEAQLQTYLPHTKHLAIEVHEEFISTAKICGLLEKNGFEYTVAPMEGQSSFVFANKIV